MSSTEFNQGSQRLLLEMETSAKFNQVKPRLDKLNQEIEQDYPSKIEKN